MFRGKLYGGQLFAGQLFYTPLDEEPQVELPFYYGSGKVLRAEEKAAEEKALVDKVLEKWRVVEEARVKKATQAAEKRKAVRLEVVALDQGDAATESSSAPEPVENVPDLGAIAPDSGAIELSNPSLSGKPALPIIQTLFTPGQQPERRAPTRSTPVTVISVEDDMDDVMTVLLALEEAGEI